MAEKRTPLPLAKRKRVFLTRFVVARGRRVIECREDAGQPTARS